MRSSTIFAARVEACCSVSPFSMPRSTSRPNPILECTALSIWTFALDTRCTTAFMALLLRRWTVFPVGLTGGVVKMDQHRQCQPISQVHARRLYSRGLILDAMQDRHPVGADAR